MSTGITYSILEGFKGLKRAKFSAAISTFTIFLTLALIAGLLIILFNVHHFVNQIQSRLELEVFIDNSLEQAQVDSLRGQIKKLEGIENVHFVSKEEAAEYIKQQFGQDVFEILDENPLPASFRIKLIPKFRNAKTTKTVIDNLQKLDGIDDILYRQDLILLMEKYKQIFLIIMMILGALLSAASIILVVNTIKLIIFYRQSIIEIMKLVGATRGFIRRPFIIEGIVQGVTGGGLASLFFYVLFKIVKIEIPGLLFFDQRIFVILLLLGFLFGFIGSVFALRKFLKY